MSKLTNLQKRFFTFSLMFAIGFGFVPKVSAMHIMEGYLSPTYAILWGVISLPFLVYGIFKIQRLAKENPKTLILLAMAGAFTFVLSALKLPSVTGSSSHPTGTGLGAVLFGPAVTSVLGTIVLLFQAILLAHGGITTLGANIFSMAIAGPLLTFSVYKLCTKLGLNRRIGVFLGAFLGSLFTYVVTSVQLGLMYPSAVGGVAESTLEFMGLFALTQIPLSIIEGLLTVAVVIGLESLAKPELAQLGYLGGKQ